MKREENERRKKYLRNKGRIRRNKETNRAMGGPVRETKAGRKESEINSRNKETEDSTKDLKQQKFNEDLTSILKEERRTSKK